MRAQIKHVKTGNIYLGANFLELFMGKCSNTVLALSIKTILNGEID